MRISKSAIVLEDPLAFIECAFEASPDCMRLLSLDGRLEFMNERGRQLCGIDEISTRLGRPWIEVWPAAFRPTIQEAIDAAARGETRTFMGQCPTRAGARRWWDVTVSPVFSSKSGKPIRICARSRDITEELKTQSLLGAIVRNAPLSISAKEAETGRYVLANDAAEAYLGIEGSCLGKTDREVLPQAYAEQTLLVDREVVASAEPRVYEGEFVSPKTGRNWIRTTKICVRDYDGAEHIVSIAADITQSMADRHALEQALAEAQAASKAKSEFLATMSHEIRTPLNGVLGMAHALAKEEMSPRQRDGLNVIRRSGETLLAILNDVLDLSKIEAGKLELECEAFDMEHVTRGAAAAFQAAAHDKNLAFEVNVEPLARGTYRGDTTRIRRLIYNLLSNAIKFTNRGSVSLEVSRRGDDLLFVVSDTGIGIERENLPRVFEQFVQCDSSNSRQFGGSGLGLSICRGLVQMMKGSIDVESTPGSGSTFTIKLPLEKVSEDGLDRINPSETAELKPALRVLAAEDNEMNRIVLSTLLEQAGIVPQFACDGLEAIDAWEGSDWDVILMDVQMPRMDGVAAAKHIRAREKALGRGKTPIIAVTANTMTHQIGAYQAAGIDSVIDKPLRPEQLFSAIDEAIAWSATIRAA